MSLSSRRDSAAVGALHELASSNELKKCLECPICNEVPLAPIYTCSKGHTICGKCRAELRCGICQEDLSRTPRNVAIELIVASSSFWCKYLADGCSRILKGSEYRAHAEECEFRWIYCYEKDFRRCDGAKIRFKDYFRHLKTDHDVDGFQMEKNILTMSEYSNDLNSDGPWPPYYLEYDEEVFLRNMKIENSVVYWWFTILGSTSDAQRYQVKVTIYMKHDPSSKCEWTIPVYSIRKPQDQLQHSFRVAIPTQQLKAFSQKREHPHGDIFNYVFDLKYEIIMT
ncbi:unnamed protein product [Allacma fusca]|uniref:E3 ubiquitin-protein ligase Sina-like RING finger domain-containing protein n=1 Tax=Allacma fusca TaxID=39272 RepID=A0A8J2KZA1_9HEXA|nr:unnamed protein product [Allacma fusca]